MHEIFFYNVHVIYDATFDNKNVKTKRFKKVLDQAPCHLTTQVRRAFQEHRVDPIYIPKRFTSLLQPPGVSWMRPLKQAYRDKWQEWMINDEHTFTAAGNSRSPGYARAVKWIADIWADLPGELISTSFDACGIASSNPEWLHRQLRYFFQTHELVDDIQDADDAADVDGFLTHHTEEGFSESSDESVDDDDEDSARQDSSGSELPDIYLN